MLIPRFSLRALLIFTAVAGVVSLVLADAVRGRSWAVGVVVGLIGLAVLFVFHWLAFLVALAGTDMSRAYRQPLPSNPTLPPPDIQPPAMTG